MLPIQSKRSVLGFYLYLLGASLFCFVLAFFTGGLFVHLYHSPEFETRNYGLVPLFLAIVALWVYILYRLIKCSPSVSIDEYGITVDKKDTYRWGDFETIALTSKQSFFFFYQKEAMTLKLKQGKEIYMIDDLYSNLWQIKQFIKSCVIDKAPVVPQAIETLDPTEAENESFSFYKGIQFLNYRGIMLWIILAGLGFAFIKNIDHPVGLVFIFCAACLSFFGLSYFLYFFGLSEKFFIVRNHNFFWVKKIYRLTDIKEVVFEQQDKWPNCVIIITNDFRSYFFPAASLWGKDFRALKQDLLKRNITVRDEIHVG